MSDGLSLEYIFALYDNLLALLSRNMWMSKHYVHMGFDIWSHFALENSLTYDIFDSLRFLDGALGEVLLEGNVDTRDRE